jgi:hypothetical protein
MLCICNKHALCLQIIYYILYNATHKANQPISLLSQSLIDCIHSLELFTYKNTHNYNNQLASLLRRPARYGEGAGGRGGDGCARTQLDTVLRRSMAMVIGPTPPVSSDRVSE